MLFAGYALNFFGSGMTMPFLMLYLHNVRHLSLGVAGLVMSVSSLAGLLVSPIVGWAVDRLGTIRVLWISLVILTISTAGYAVALTVWSALIISILNGIGNSTMWNALSARLAVLAGKAERGRYFGVAYAVQNLGLGIGAGVAGLLTHLQEPATFVRIFLFDAVTYVVFIPFVLLARLDSERRSAPDPTEAAVHLSESAGMLVDSAVHLSESAAMLSEDAALVSESASSEEQRSVKPSTRTGYAQVLRDRALLAVTALNLLFVIFGFSQLNSAFPVWAAGSAGAGTGVAGFAFFANCIAIALIQVPVLRLTERWRRTRSLAVAALGFAICWLMVLAGGQHHGLWTAAMFVLGFVVFGIGETFLSPSVAPLVNDLASDALRGRYNATVNLSWQAGTIIGPVLAGTALNQGAGKGLFITLAVVCGLGVFAAIGLERIVPASANRTELV